MTNEGIGCLVPIVLVLGSAIVGEIISSFDEKEERPRYRTNYTPNPSGSGRCAYPSDIAIDGSRCGNRASSVR